jgi:hypothetical protein
VKRVLLASLTAAIASVVAPSITGAATPEPASLQKYLASMSWPVRTAVLRVEAETAWINGWIAIGDPPFLGGIAGRCRHLRAIETDARGGLLLVSAPARLQRAHLQLSRGYSKVRAECLEARRTALALRTAMDRAFVSGSADDELASRRAEASARQSLHRFVRTTLRSFIQTVHTWRLAVLRDVASLGVAPPKWLQELPV